MALIRFSPQHDPINALLNLQSALERGFSNPFGLDLGLSGRGVFPPSMSLVTRTGILFGSKFRG
jgi:hypothetical protein